MTRSHHRTGIAFTIATIIAFSAFATTAFSQPTTQSTSPQRWEKAIHAFEEADKKNPPPQHAILFYGASGIVKWKTLNSDFPEYQILNRAFGGSFMSDCLYYTDRLVIPYHPHLIVIQAGGNDINGGHSPEQVFEDFKSFVAKVRNGVPDARIAYLSMNPSPKRWNQRDAEQKGNQLIKDWIATQDNLDYIDFWPAMLGPDGLPREDLFVADKLHNNEAGYKIRAEVVRPHLK